MPAKPEWYSRLDQITASLEALPVPYIDRATVQTLLHVGPRRAQQILLPCASLKVGSSSVAEKSALIVRLRSIADDGFFEAGRRRRVAEVLADAQKQPRVMIEAPADIVNQRFDALPAGVTIQPGRVTVEFETPQQALEKLLALAMAIGNDFEGWERMAGA